METLGPRKFLGISALTAVHFANVILLMSGGGGLWHGGQLPHLHSPCWGQLPFRFV